MSNTAKPTKLKLHYKFVTQESLDADQRDRMYHLLVSNYNETSETLFRKDLANKNFVLLIKDEADDIQGFSTVSINPKNTGTKQFNILFSGDTIIDPEHWGTQELVKGFADTVGRLLAHEPNKEWYWFLMSKGHRTYMYLPLFYSEYYPSLKHDHPKLKTILNDVSEKLFGDNWHPDKDLIIFQESMGELKKEHIEDTYLKKKNKHVGFFLEKNPGFYKGHELACIAPLSFENIHPRQHQYMQKGFDIGLTDLDLKEVV